ncbi:MAG: hypothetical protein GXX84_00225 [Acidobacteria bacterium]|nr:hypothetical protein [Acidobacteriota bacterium]
MPEEKVRIWIARGFRTVEDVVYTGLGLLLAVTSIGLLAIGFIAVINSLLSGTLTDDVVLLLDRILLVLLIVEIMYTVQVSFREHALVPEPFLLIGLIAVTRRVLVLTAELPRWIQDGELFRNALIELAVLTAMIIVLVAAIMLLRRKGVD